MKKIPAIVFAGIAGYVIVATAVLGIGFQLVSYTDRNQDFWLKLLWTEVLILLIYLPAFSFFKATDRNYALSRSVVGVLPGAKIALIFYALISFSLIIINTYNHGEKLSFELHLALQIILLAVMGTIFALMSVSHTAASAGIEKKFPLANSPNELSDKLHCAEELLKFSNNSSEWAPVIHSLKKLREMIKYSLPHLGGIGDSSEYQKYATNVSNLIELIGKSEVKTDEIALFQKKISELISSTKSLSQTAISH
jgi:hypothetical protein